MQRYLAADGAVAAAPAGAGERAAQLALVRFAESRHGAALGSMLRVAALLREVDTAGVEPLECLSDGRPLRSGAREQQPFEPAGTRPGQLLLLPPVQTRQ